MYANKKIFLILFFIISLFAKDEEILKQIETLQSKNRELFVKVKLYTDELLQKEKESLKNLNLDDDSSIKELQEGLQKAYNIAKLNGFNIAKLKNLYELSKKVILRSDFITQDSKEAVNTTNTFLRWVDITNFEYARIQEEKAKAQSQRVAFYKKVTLQYIKAIAAKDPYIAYKEFKKYVNSLRKIQSADSEQLIAQAETLVAEQKLIADLSSGLPVVGEAIDITSLVTGKDLSGHQLSNCEKAFTFVTMLTPEVLTQLIQRNKNISKSLAKIEVYLSNLPQKAKANFKNINIVEKKLSSLGTPSEEIIKWRKFYNQKLEEAKKLASIPQKIKIQRAKEIEKNIAYVFERKSDMTKEFEKKFKEIATKKDRVIITRPVNQSMFKRLEEGAYTKGMNVKGKSADSGIANGLIPRNQKFSKLKDPNKIKEFQKKVDKSLEVDVVNGVEFRPGMVKSKQLIVKKDGINYYGVEIVKKDGKSSLALFVTDSGKIVDENFHKVKKELLKEYDLKNLKPFEVLTDLKDNYLTADIDLLAIGTKNKNSVAQEDVLMGYITSGEEETIIELNRAMKTDAYKDRLLIHHGAENNFMNKNSKPDFPLTAYSPDGKTAVLKNEKELKEYFHMQKLKGYDLQPNPFWGWGKYDPKKGYE